MPQFKEYDTIKGVLPNDDILVKCIHCGMCLATCPTYDITKMERSSPRGRIRLIKSVAEGKLPLTDTFYDEMNFCLDCQACETACPAGVKYGVMVEAARVEVRKAKLDPFLQRVLRRFGLNIILASKPMLKLTALFFKIYQNFGIRTLLHKSGFFKLIGHNLGELDGLLPSMSKKSSEALIKNHKLVPEGKPKYKIAFLTGCLMDVAYADINMDTIDILIKNNCEIVIPKGQVCCGSLHAHYGEQDKAEQLARKNLDAFSKSEYDFLVSNSAGCGAYMKEYAHLFADDPEYADKAKVFSSKVKDISEFLQETGINPDMGTISEPVTYHDACHLAHTQKITEQPRNMLKAIPGIDLRELHESTWCCGSGGIYNVVRYNDAMIFLERKMNNIVETGAKIVVTANPGCMAQIQYGARKRKLELEVIHPATLLNRAYNNKNGGNKS